MSSKVNIGKVIAHIVLWLVIGNVIFVIVSHFMHIKCAGWDFTTFDGTHWFCFIFMQLWYVFLGLGNYWTFNHRRK